MFITHKSSNYRIHLNNVNLYYKRTCQSNKTRKLKYMIVFRFIDSQEIEWGFETEKEADTVIELLDNKFSETIGSKKINISEKENEIVRSILNDIVITEITEER